MKTLSSRTLTRATRRQPLPRSRASIVSLPDFGARPQASRVRLPMRSVTKGNEIAVAAGLRLPPNV